MKGTAWARGFSAISSMRKCWCTLDVSSASARDPVDDFEVITRELELFPGRDASGDRLSEKPVIVAANKIDALDDPSRLERLRHHLQAGAFRFTLSRRLQEIGSRRFSRPPGAKSRPLAKGRRRSP